MALANFFSRASIAAAYVLQGFDDEQFRRRVSRCTVAIALDANAASTSEGVATLELSVDLLARFYPAIVFVNLDGDPSAAALIARLKTAARKINWRIDLKGRLGKAACGLVVGRSALVADAPLVSVRSHGWTAKLSHDGPVGSADTGNPFGASVAACLGVANVFRIVFADQLPHGAPDENLELDVLHCVRGPSPVDGVLPDVLDIGEAHLVGLGAIGRATAWSLARVRGLTGKLHLVDHELMDLPNLQRYVGTRQGDIGGSKVKSAASLFAQPSLSIVPHQALWGEYLRQRGDCNLETVVVALDTARDRMAVQTALPRRLLNAWTQPGDLGVSRHGFLDGPCLMCLYLPTHKVPNESDLVAQALHLLETEVRGLLHADATVNRPMAERISAASGVSIDALAPFIGLPLRAFYSRAVCGTTVFGSANGGDRGNMAVPMAFQSALAGILLAVELVEDAANLRRAGLPAVSKINLCFGVQF